MCDSCESNFNLGIHLPFILSCGHSICKICLEKLKNKRMKIRCPVDNLEHGNTGFNKEEVPKNEYIITLLREQDHIIPNRSNFIYLK